MASIPHGTTIEAQGLVAAAQPGPPTIATLDITPSVTGSNPVKKVTFASTIAFFGLLADAHGRLILPRPA